MGGSQSMHRIVQVGSVFIAESAVVVGDVQFGEDCNVWHQCVIRGDVAPIRIGKRVNIQDGSLLHCKHGVALEIGDDVAVGHHAVVHCKRVGGGTLVATRATILDDCEIGEDCIIAAGAVVPPRTIIPNGSVVMGIPARVVRPIRPDEREYVRYVVRGYMELSRRHAAGEFVPFRGMEEDEGR
jgi:carbonic anhydrase/acetyltransferase-like protein (isoleucine patch superfamily)